MNEIGGFFELELNQGKELHSSALKLNLGRTSFEYILRAKNVEKVYLPYYTCDVMLEPLKKLSIKYEFYHINNNLEPVFNYKFIKGNDFFIYNNYFGLKDGFIHEISNKVKNLIIDNAQAFFSKPIPGVDTFYSPRKFFGVPDGAYLYTESRLNMELQKDVSNRRINHLIGRIEFGAEENFKTFRENDAILSGQSIKKMSNLTHRLLKNINYSKASGIRKKNFFQLHEYLRRTNQIKIDLGYELIPMIYPFLISNGFQLKKELIRKKIFVATYWPNVLGIISKDSWEYYLTKNLIALPIDQRYSEKEMSKIIENLEEYL